MEIASVSERDLNFLDRLTVVPIANFLSCRHYTMAAITQESFAPPAWMAELESVIHELRRGTPEERLRLDTASVEIPGWREATDTWLPSHSMADLLQYSIRPQVYFIQSIVDPDFTLSTPFPPMKASLGQEVRGAIRRVLDQLVRPPFAWSACPPF